MKISIALFSTLIFSLIASVGISQEVPPAAKPIPAPVIVPAPLVLQITIAGLQPGARIPDELTFCVPDATRRSRDGENKSPAINWSNGPAGTKSYAIIMHDTDVPTVFDDANKENKVIPSTLPRMDFFHWVLVDIPAGRTSLALAEDSNGVMKPGKPVGPTDHGLRGKNDFGNFLSGVFGGYDGPCPPWNDTIMHHYHFTVYALDVESLGLSGAFGGKDALNAMQGHVLAQGSVMGTYTQNPNLMKP